MGFGIVLEYVDDIDEDGLTLTVSDNDSVTVNIVDFSVTFGAVQDWNGTETLTFTINDNQGRDIAVDEIGEPDEGKADADLE